jgi:hypothetical protein
MFMTTCVIHEANCGKPKNPIIDSIRDVHFDPITSASIKRDNPLSL